MGMVTGIFLMCAMLPALVIVSLTKRWNWNDIKRINNCGGFGIIIRW
jgi:hypothetical protein